ncbi:MAG: PD-(D/E)XK nuclease family protein [Ornithinimicrobium sp.]
MRYLPLDYLAEDLAMPEGRCGELAAHEPFAALLNVVEPGLLERVIPLLEAFENDLLWAQSRAAQELFHSNTIAWLLRNHPVALTPVLAALGGGATHDASDGVEVWRERRNIDIVIDAGGSSPKIVVENKLYSVPYPEQLLKYNAYPLPWSSAHDDSGADNTTYVLLSLMRPSFPLPSPWVHVDYRELASALDAVDADALGRAVDQFARYRVLVHRLVSLAEAVDPAQALDERFSAAEAVAQLPGGGLDGAIARMRFSGLAQVVQSEFGAPKSFDVGGARGGIITYWRRLSADRSIGWQFQENQLRFQITVETPELQGKSSRGAREKIVESEHIEFFDHDDLDQILGIDLRPKVYEPGKWLGFNPDFVYRHRPVEPTVSTRKLASALACMTRRVDQFADEIGYDVE